MHSARSSSMHSASHEPSTTRLSEAGIVRSRQAVLERVRTFFSVVDCLSGSVTKAEIYTNFRSLMLCIQVIVTSFWAPLNDFWRGWMPTRVMNYIAYFHIEEDGLNTNIYSLFGVLVFSATLICALAIFHWFYFAKHRRLAKGTVTISIFLLEFVCFVLLLPAASLLGSFLWFISGGDWSIGVICLAVFCSLCMLVMFCGAIISDSFNAQSMFAQTQWNYTDRSYYRVLVLGIECLFIVLGHLFNFYPAWPGYVLVSVHFLFNIAIAVIFSRGVYLLGLSDAWMVSAMIAGCGCDIMRLASFYSENDIIRWGVLGVALGLPVIVFVIFVAVRKRKIRKIEAMLAYNRQQNQWDMAEKCEPLTHAEKLERLEQLNLDSPNKARWFLYVGLDKCCDLFIDFSLIRYVAEVFQTDNIIYECLRITSFFPNGGDLPRLLLSRFNQSKTLNAVHRYLLFQVYIVLLSRQTYSTNAASRKLGEMKALSRDLEVQMMNIWSESYLGLGNLQELAKRRVFLTDHWRELLNECPNNTAYYEGFLRYQVECCSDFVNGIAAESRMKMLANDTHKVLDRAFLSFAAMFPKYLRKGVLDMHGVGLGKRDSSSFESLGWMKSLSDTDIITEADIASCHLFLSPRLRTGLQRALKANYDGYKIRHVAVFIITVVLACILYPVALSIFWNFFVAVQLDGDHVLELGKCRYYFLKSLLYTTLAYAQNTGQANFTPIYSNETLEESDNFAVTAYEMLKTSQTSLESFTASIRQESDHEKIWATTKILTQETLSVGQCWNGKPIEPFQLPLTYSFAYEYALIGELLLPTTDWQNIYVSNPQWCSLINTVLDISDTFDSANRNVFDRFMQTFHNFRASLMHALIATPIVVFIVLYIPIPIFSALRERRIVSLMNKLLAQIRDEGRKEAQAPLLRDAIGHEYGACNAMITRKKWSTTIICLHVSLLFFFIAMDVCVTLMVYSTYNANEEVLRMQYWTYTCIFRRVEAMQVVAVTAQAIYIWGTKSEIRNVSQLVDIVNDLLNKISDSTTMMMTDGDGVESSAGLYPALDHITMNPQCEVGNVPRHLHELYECNALNMMLNAFSQEVLTIITDIPAFNGSLEPESPTHMIHMALFHVDILLGQLETMLLDLKATALDQHKISLVVCMVAGLFFAALYCFSFALLSSEYDGCLNTVTIAVLRLPPSEIATNEGILNILMDRAQTDNQHGMHVLESIICYSNLGVVCLTIGGMIEYVNQTITNMLGYSPEHLLGQSWAILFDEASQEVVKEQLEPLLSNVSESFYEDSLVCITHNGETIVCGLSAFSIKAKNFSDSHYVFAITDLTSMVEKRTLAEAAKTQTEELMNEIVPPQIIGSLRSNSEVAFSVPMASVMFADIVKFNEYSCHLTPQVVLSTISLIFGGFDQKLKALSRVTKIKVMGDRYLCAAGLFDEANGQEESCKEIVQLGIEALHTVDDFNIKMNTQLALRVGINTGPVIAGILGHQKMLFDIFGETIDVADLLQCTAPPNHMHISAQTYSAVAACGWPFQKHESSARGKTTVATYLLSTDNLDD